jgi:hypothetical protein
MEEEMKNKKRFDDALLFLEDLGYLQVRYFFTVLLAIPEPQMRNRNIAEIYCKYCVGSGWYYKWHCDGE